MMRTDVELLDDKDIKKMNQLIKELDGKDSDEEFADENELDDLAIEATLPVEELAQKYGITIETPETQAKILDEVNKSSGKSEQESPDKENPESSTNVLLDDDADFDDDSEASEEESENESESSASSDGENQKDVDASVESEKDPDVYLKLDPKKLKEIQEEGYDSKFEKAGVDSGATTVICLLADNGVLVVANAGDSRCLVGRKRLNEDNKENIGNNAENGHEKDEEKSSHIAIDMSIDHKPEDPRELQRMLSFLKNNPCKIW